MKKIIAITVLGFLTVCAVADFIVDNLIVNTATTVNGITILQSPILITNNPLSNIWLTNTGGALKIGGSGAPQGLISSFVSAPVSPSTFDQITITGATNNGLTASQLVATDVNKKLVSTTDGSSLTINAGNINAGSLSDARLSANVALLNANQTFSGANIFSNTTFNSSSGARTLTPNVAAGQDPTNRGVYVASGLLRFEGNGGFYSTNTGGGGGGNTYIPMFVGANGSGFQFQTGSKALTIVRPDGGVVFFDFDGAGNISDQPLNVIGALRSTTTIAAGTTITATNGFASYASNLTAPVSIGSSIAATNGGFNWTNNTGLDISVFIDNQGVTATSIKKNGGQIFSSALGDQTIPLHPNQWISILYAVGTPTITYTP